MLLCAHMDTVPLGGPVEVVEEDGVLRNKHDAVLGADNKAAIATILGAVRAMRTRSVGVELLFTTHEEDGLLGAHAFDRSRLRAEMGFVFDHATPIGEVIVAAPTYQKVEARFRGVAAHAGIRPEDGKSAIEAAARFLDRVPLGRLDDETTANAGRIEGGGATNVVPDSCLVELEARSIDHDRAAEVVTAMVDAATEAASDLDCDVETTVEELFRGFRLRRSSPPVEVAMRALGPWGSSQADHHRRRQRRQRADSRRAAHGQRGQRHRAKPPARRGGDRSGAGEDAGRDPGDRRGGGQVSFEKIGSEEIWSGKIATVRVDRVRFADGEEADREVVAHPGAVGIVAHDGERMYFVRQPREAVGEQSLLELPAGKLEDDGALETAKRELAEEIGKGAESWRAPDLLLDLARLRRRGVPPVPGHGPLRPLPGPRRGRAHRDRHRPPRRARRRDPRLPRRQDAGGAAVV